MSTELLLTHARLGTQILVPFTFLKQGLVGPINHPSTQMPVVQLDAKTEADNIETLINGLNALQEEFHALDYRRNQTEMQLLAIRRAHHNMQDFELREFESRLINLELQLLPLPPKPTLKKGCCAIQ